MMFIEKYLSFAQMNTQTENLGTLAIKLQNNYIVAAVYNTSQNEFNQGDLDDIFGLGHEVLAVGDWNAKHKIWNFHRNNSYGKQLLKYHEDNRINSEIPDKFTLLPYNSNSPSTVDFVLNKNINCVSEIEVFDELNSDHLPIFFSLDETDIKENIKVTFLNCSKAGWEKIQKLYQQQM